MKYIPQSSEDRAELLKAAGFKNTDQLFENIPEKYRLKKPLQIPFAQSEIELRETFQNIAQCGKSPEMSFAGCGIYNHYVPSIVPTIQSRSEFATAYTPYQPEISQGLLQAIFEYQTLACQLTETELSNASLFDGATSLVEGLLMALRIKRKSEGKILISSALHPLYRQVLETYCGHYGDRFIDIPLSGDQLDLKKLKELLNNEADIILTQSPNIFGVIEKHSEIGKLVQDSNALWVSSSMEPLSFALLRGPGAFGAHIVTAEGQSFGNHPYLGGSSFGIFCTRNEYIRQLPGRLVGETVDADGKRAYTLTFATREQFIRREKATSNICTNQNLNMLGGLIYLATLGKEGLKELSTQNLSITEYAKKLIREKTKLKISDSPTFNEFVVELPIPAENAVAGAERSGWVCGVDLGRFKSEWKHKLLIHLSELHQKKQITKLVDFLSQLK